MIDLVVAVVLLAGTNGVNVGRISTIPLAVIRLALSLVRGFSGTLLFDTGHHRRQGGIGVRPTGTESLGA